MLYWMEPSLFFISLNLRETEKPKLTIKPMFSGIKSKFLNPVVKSLILSQKFTEHQDQIHNSQSPE